MVRREMSGESYIMLPALGEGQVILLGHIKQDPGCI